MAKNVKLSAKPNDNVISDVKDLGKHIKFHRTKEGLTLDEAAKLCNINTLTLMRLEKGADGVRLSTALLVSKMFGLKLVVE